MCRACGLGSSNMRAALSSAKARPTKKGLRDGSSRDEDGEKQSTRSSHFPVHLRRRLVRSKPYVNRLPQEAVGRPGEIGDLGDQLRLNPMHLRKYERRSEARLARRRSAQRRARARQGLQTASQVREHLVRHSRTHAAGIDEPTVVGAVAKQKRAEMRPRSFRIGPADDNEFLPVEAFRFAPQASISGSIGCIDLFDTTPSGRSRPATKSTTPTISLSSNSLPSEYGSGL